MHHTTIEEKIDSTGQDAINAYGESAQINKAIEELGELVTALARNSDPAVYLGDSDPVIDEIADCIIMLRQLRLIYGEEDTDKRIRYKLKRLTARIKKA